MNEFKSFLARFDGGQVVQQACYLQYGHFRRRICPVYVMDGISKGLLTVVDGDGPVQGGDAVYSRDLILTDSGRQFCGITKPQEASKQVTKSLFD